MLRDQLFLNNARCYLRLHRETAVWIWLELGHSGCRTHSWLYFSWLEHILAEWVFRSQRSVFICIAGFTGTFAQQTHGLPGFHVSPLALNVAFVFWGKNKQNCLSDKLLLHLSAPSFVIRQVAFTAREQTEGIHVSRRHSSRRPEYSQPCSWVLDEGFVFFFFFCFLLFVIYF